MPKATPDNKKGLICRLPFPHKKEAGNLAMKDIHWLDQAWTKT
ncbi:MAG: hypothetical protein V1706_10375 [Pseudomonadota bacterium]